MVQLDVTVVNVALARIGASFGGGVAGLQWVVNAYTIVFASLILTAGALGDRLGAKRLFIGGFWVFVAASMGCGAAPNLAVLIAARAAQGIGAAALVPCSLSLLHHAYDTPASRANAVGIWAGVASVALAGGPVIGGVLIAWAGWRPIFFINLPIGLTGIYLTARYAGETTRSSDDHKPDLPGLLLAVVAIAALAAVIIEGGALGWRHPLILAGAGLFVATAAAFLAVEARSLSPMLDLSVFHHPTFSAATLVGLLINIAFYGLIFDFSLYFQQLRRWTALQTGLAFVPMTGIVLGANLLASRVSGRWGNRTLMLLGQAIAAVGCVVLVGIDANTSFSRLWWPMAMLGAGLGLTVPPMTSALLATVDRSRSGVASGVLNTTRQVGSVIGVALFGMLIASGSVVPGMHIALLVSVILSVAGLAATSLAIHEMKESAG